MRNLRELGSALLVAFISIGLVAGALSISTVEFTPPASATPTSVAPLQPEPLTATPTTPPTATLDLAQASPTASLIPTASVTSTPPPNCQIPAGWIQVIVQVGETINTLAARYRTTPDQLQAGNCLSTANLISGTIIYVPPVAPNTPVACLPGKVGWSKSYVVKAGDNLYRIGYDHYVTLEEMRSVNCRVGDIIYAGEVLYVPNVASRTPLSSASPVFVVTNTPAPTEPLTITPLPYTATIMPISTLPLTSTIIPTDTLQP
ncbi:MAG: LysM peptidoglycan-binding domain-containing protein [Anaerolineales bacterium]|nr:LysM peptidoglycan-binding domain-containing protein [Anaerolineales bacterium]